MRILYASMEIDPFLKLTSAADFLRLLPQGLQEQGHEIRILMPKFGVINERRNRLHEVVRLSGINIRVGTDEKPLTIKVATIPNARIQVYFLDNDDYFKRRAVLTDAKSNEFFPDNDERAIFFCKGVLETVKKLGWGPDIIHCHGWMTSLIPLYLKTHYKNDPIFENSKVVFSLNDEQLNYPLNDDFVEKAKIDGVTDELIKSYKTDNYYGFAKGGIQYADAVTRIHASLPEEIEPDYQKKLKQLKAEEPNLEDNDAHIDYYSKLYQTLLT